MKYIIECLSASSFNHLFDNIVSSEIVDLPVPLSPRKSCLCPLPIGTSASISSNKSGLLHTLIYDE